MRGGQKGGWGTDQSSSEGERGRSYRSSDKEDSGVRGSFWLEGNDQGKFGFLSED